jgi:hypothetical protein
MDPIYRVMCDVAGLITRGSDAARMEMHRMAAERERRSAAHAAAVVEQAVTAGTSAGERRLALPYKWLKMAFRRHRQARPGQERPLRRLPWVVR